MDLIDYELTRRHVADLLSEAERDRLGRIALSGQAPHVSPLRLVIATLLISLGVWVMGPIPPRAIPNIGKFSLR